MRVTDPILAAYHALLARAGISEQSKRLSQYHRARALPDWAVSVTRLGPAIAQADVSIIIPSFNYANHLPAAIESAVAAARANTHLRAEVIVFDDHSTDGSYQIALRLCRQSGIACRIIRPIWNVGLISARNISLRHAIGTYVFFLDADNTMTADGLQMLHAGASQSNADAAYGPIRRISADGDHDGFLSDRPFDETLLRTTGNYIDAMALFRRQSVLAIGGYDLDLLRWIGGHEDHDLWLRLAAAKAVIRFCAGGVVGDYVVKKDSMANSISAREYADGFRYMRTDIVAGPSQPDDGLIFDLGFHKGEDSLRYLEAGFRVLAIEADPALHASGVQSFAQAIDHQKLTLLHAAVLGWRRRQCNGVITFHPHPENSLWGTASDSFRKRNAELHGKPHAPAVEVPATSLEMLVAQYGCPRFLKVDIEGMDTEVVNDLERLTVLPPFVSWETGKQSLGKIFATHLRLYRLGYRRFRVAQQMNAGNGSQRLGAGRTSPFSQHSSGPMPEDHPMPWGGVTAALAKYVLLFIAYRLVGPGSLFWRAERHRSAVINTLPRKVRTFTQSRSIPFPGWYDTHAALPAYVNRFKREGLSGNDTSV
jgi:FkbM family methyltransferase